MRPSKQAPSRPFYRIAIMFLACALLPLAICAAPPSPEDNEPATLKVSGTGLLRNRELGRSLVLLLGKQRGVTLNTNAIEDAAVMLVSALGQEGFQKPIVEIEATLVDGMVKRFVFDATMATALPRSLEARRVEFQVKRGARWYIDSVEITGLKALPTKIAKTFFRTDSMLFVLASTNVYAPARVNRAADALLGELIQRGYAEANVRAEIVKVDEASGAVALRVDVTEGNRWKVEAVRFEGVENETVVLPPASKWVDHVWSQALQENLKQTVRHAFYASGYPDVGVRIQSEAGVAVHNESPVTLVVRIQPGLQVKIGQVRFQGNVVTTPLTLSRSAEVKSGDLLNPLALAQARYRLSRLGVFDAVDLHYEPAEGAERDPVFSLEESQRYETHLMFGYGSYEQLRGGIEFRHLNLFGRAHQSLAQLGASLKGFNGNYTYSVPQLFGESIDGSARLFGLERQEVSFLRQEYGTSFTLKRPLPWLRAEGTVSYTLQALRNKDNELSTRATDQTQFNTASIDFALTGDHRDNPLRPRRGYRWFAQLENADRLLGGGAEYQRLEFGAAYHAPWGEGRWIHLGFTHGVITTLGTTDENLPVNKRFYPGGDNSIRGYNKGEAAPRGADGLFIGAKSYLLLNFEFEQALTKNWSVIVLADALGIAPKLRDYPYAEELYSVGLGVRYQTLIGPVRLEYGRNVNPRADDPSGTLHLSVGYPF